ncbi:protein tyrosine phosphatase [Lutibacter sp. B2]|nr:protein tyrosine phosphatase [Lutibacter sp. B2]
MAEAIMKELLKKHSNYDVKIISAGTVAMDGQVISKHAIEVMKEKKIDIQEYETTQLTKERIDEADLILTMTRNHKEQVLRILPEAKVYTLKEYAGNVDSEQEPVREIQKIQRMIEKKKVEFYKENKEKIESLRKQRENLTKDLENVLMEIQNLEMKMLKYIEDEQREITYLQNKNPSIDVLDPFGQSAEVYRACADEIEENINVAFKKILDNH